MTPIRLIAILITGICLAFASPASAQDYPSRIVKIVVAFPAGGPTDFVARLLADKLKSLLGQSVIVENKPGANGAIGADYVAKSDPDGYTLFLTTTGAVAITPILRSDLPYDSRRDFAPITRVVINNSVLVVNASSSAKSAKDLAAMAAKAANTVPFASTGIGSMPHLALELFQSAAHVKFLHVPYRGAAPALTDLLGGQVQALFADVPVLISHIKAGKLRPLGVAAAKRSEVLPEVPTLIEQGYPDTLADNWYALFAPAKTPPAIISKLHEAVKTAVNDPGVRGKLIASGAAPAVTSPDELAKLLDSELKRWGAVIAAKGIKTK